METLSFEDSLKVLRSNSNADLEKRLQAIRDELEPKFREAEKRVEEFSKEAPAFRRFIQKVTSLDWGAAPGLKVDDLIERAIEEMNKILRRVPDQFEGAKQALADIGPPALQNQFFISRLRSDFRSSDGALSRLRGLKDQVEQRMKDLAAVAGRR